MNSAFRSFSRKNELIPDSGGAGQWRGAPGVECRIRQRFDPGVWIYPIDGHHNPARGVAGGQAGRAQNVWKYKVGKNEPIDLPKVSQEVLSPDEVLVSESGGGGGFGDPLLRDPDRVRRDVREEYVTVEQAGETYGVVLGPESLDYPVREEETGELRRRLREVQS